MSSIRRARALERFSENRLFEGIGAEVLETIAPQIGVRRMCAGEVIFREGDAGDSLYLVGEGSVKISKPGTAGEQEIVGYIEPGNFFGATSLLAGEPHSATATAVEPVLIGAVKAETFQR